MTQDRIVQDRIVQDRVVMDRLQAAHDALRRVAIESAGPQLSSNDVLRRSRRDLAPVVSRQIAP